MPLFSRFRPPKDFVCTIRALLQQLRHPTTQDKDRPRVRGELSRQISLLKHLLNNAIAGNVRRNVPASGKTSNGSEKSAANSVLMEVAMEFQHENTLYLLIDSLDRLDWDTSKHAVEIITRLMYLPGVKNSPLENYLLNNSSCLEVLINGYTKPDRAIQYGSLLRHFAQSEVLVGTILELSAFYRLFNYVKYSSFDISTDIFSSIKELLTQHKMLVGKYLERHYISFTHHYNTLLECDNYVLKRQALKLLSEVLLERANCAMMTRYIADANNLKRLMNILKAKEKQIAFEAFHCFKVFVANPNKSFSVQYILSLNQEKLIEFLNTFLPDRQDDMNFINEKSYLIRTIREMEPPENIPFKTLSNYRMSRDIRSSYQLGGVSGVVTQNDLAASSSTSTTRVNNFPRGISVPSFIRR